MNCTIMDSTKVRSNRHLSVSQAILCMVLLMGIGVFTTCRQGVDPTAIIKKAIRAHGGEKLNRSEITFTFRGKQFLRRYNNGNFLYTRHYVDSTGHHIYQAINNDSTWQEVDGSVTPLSDSVRSNIYESINSIIYFGFLPFKLDDKAVNHRYLGEETISNQPYHKIEITFDKQGGGIDYQDRFIYWIHKKRYHMDYFSYRYEVEGGGERFREAYNVRTIKGIRFQDYKNYKTAADTLLPDRRIEKFAQLYKQENIEQVSTVAFENVEVKLLDNGSLILQ